jgi:serine/threonine-protein kinase
MPLRIQLLGPVSVSRNGKSVPILRSRKVRALLAYLALATGPFTRSRLCDLLWDAPNDPRGELRWCLSKLRTMLDDERRRVVTIGNDRVALDLSDCTVDVLELERAAGDALSTFDPQSLARLEGSLGGELLDGLQIDGSAEFTAWLSAQRQRCRAAHVRILAELTNRSEPASDEMFRHLESWLQLSAFDTRAHERMLDALASLGRVRDAEEHLALATRSFEKEGLDCAPLRDAWQRRAARPQPSSASTKTIAVLPFRNEGPSEDDFVAEGLADDLIDTLSMTRGLRVRPRATVARFKGEGLDLQDIGRQLGVEVIVDGSLRRAGDDVRLGVRLIGTADGFQLWARRFQGRINELLVESDALARAIADTLTTERPVVERAASNDPAAVELYLRARAEFRKSWNRTAEPAAKLFESALALAPSDAKVVTGSALAYVRMIFFGEGERGATIARADDLTARAVALAPELGDAWAALASFRLHTGDPGGAAEALRSGVEHAPQSALLQEMLGRLLLEANAIDRATVHLDIACELDPTLFTARFERCRAYGLLGDWVRADALLSDALKSGGLDAGATVMARAQLALWQGAKAPDVEARPNTYASVFLAVLRSRALTAEHRAFIHERVLGTPGRLRAFFNQRNAEIHAALGETDAAIADVDASVRDGLIDLAWMDRSPTLASLREDARWTSMRAVVESRASQILAVLR